MSQLGGGGGGDTEVKTKSVFWVFVGGHVKNINGYEMQDVATTRNKFKSL